MIVHATPADLEGKPWNRTLPAPQAEALLARAATVIRNLTMTATYRTGPDGKPVDTAIAEALRDATCAQAVWFDDTGDTGSGAARSYSTMSLGSARLSLGGGGSATNVSVATGRYSPEAVDILNTAGLLNREVGSA